MISFQQLRFFNTALQLKSISLAANHLNRTQPAVSAGIKALETQLGLKLFERTKGKLIPTSEALFLAERASKILGDLETTESLLKGSSDKHSGEISIACLPSAAQFFLPNLVANFMSRRPDIILKFYTHPSDTIHGLVASQQVDIGIAENPQTQDDSFNIEVFPQTGFLAVNERSPLAQLPEITPSDLAKENFVGLFKDHPSTRAIRDYVERDGNEFRQSIQVNAIVNSFTFVEQQLGYSFVNRLTMESYHLIKHDYNKVNRVLFRTIRDLPSVDITLIKPRFKISSNATIEFYDLLKKALAQD